MASPKDAIPSPSGGYKVSWQDRDIGGRKLSERNYDYPYFLRRGLDIDDENSDDENRDAAGDMRTMDERLLVAVVDVTARGGDGGEDIVSLLEDGANVNARNNEGRTPLHLVVYTYAAAFWVEFLLDKGANANAKDNSGLTPLHCLLLQFSPKAEVASMLVEHGASVNEKGKYELTPLHLACWMKDKDMVELLLKKEAVVDARCESGTTPLHLCLFAPESLCRSHAMTGIVSALLEHGANPNAQDENQALPLHLFFAELGGDCEAVRLLLEKGANVNAKDKDGTTPLHLLCSSSHADEKAFRLFLENGADASPKDKCGATPIHWASMCQYDSVFCTIMLEKGGDVNAMDHNGSTLLHWASKSGSTDTARFLCDKGVDVKAKDKNNVTALHWAAHGGYNTDLAEFLLERGADVNAEDKDGATPLDWTSSVPMARFLIQKGAKKKSDFVDWITPCGFPMALGCNVIREPRSLVEVQIMEMSGAIRDKPEWWRKVHDDAIAGRWQREALAGIESAEDRELQERQFRYALAECRWLSKQYESGPVCPAAVDGVFVRDGFDPDLLNNLLRGIAELRCRPAIGATTEDRHPGTPQMVDLVHPSLYCYEGGKTKVLPNAGADALLSPNWEEFVGSDGVVLKDQDGQLQWLPSEFFVNADGSHCQINSYINSLHPGQYSHLYRNLGSLFCHALSLLEEVLAEAGTYFPDETTRKQELRVSIPDWWEEMRDQREDESDDEYDNYMDNFWDTRTFYPPVVPEEFSPPAYNKPRAEVSLRDRPLQVIVKIASLELDVGESYEGGAWHVEGTMMERIVATACCYLESTNVTGGELHFRTDIEEPDYEQGDHVGIRRVYGLEHGQLLVQHLGHCTTNAGRVLAWPNTLQHRVAPVSLIDPKKPGKRTICCFFLVDPTVRVRSTATVPPQQLAWLSSDVVSLPLEAQSLGGPGIIDHVSEYMASDSILNFEQACERRARLMKERGSQQDGGDTVERTFNLCEH